MTSKRIEEEEEDINSLLLFCCCLKIERKNYIQKQTISKTHDEFFLRGLPTREREKQTRGEMSCRFTSLSRAKKKFRVSREEKTQQTTSEKEKEKKRQNKQTTDFFFVRRKHFTPILEDSFIRKKSSCSCSLLLRSRRDQRCFFQEDILETINNKHRKS